MKITFRSKPNTKDLFIKNYEMVPEIYKEHIPPPYIGWISLKYEGETVKFVLNSFPSKIDSKPRSKVIDNISLEQAKFLESEVDKWNNISKTT